MSCAPNRGFGGNLSLSADFHGSKLVAFGSGKRVVILTRESMTVVDVTEEMLGIVHAVSFSGNARNDELLYQMSRATVPEQAVCQSGHSIQGTLAVAMIEAVIILVPQRMPRDHNFNHFSWKWKSALRLDSIGVVHLVWCPVSNFLVTGSASEVSGWNVTLKKFYISESIKDTSGTELETFKVVAAPIWSLNRLDSVDSVDCESTHVDCENTLSRFSFSIDGVSTFLNSLFQ